MITKIIIVTEGGFESYCLGQTVNLNIIATTEKKDMLQQFMEYQDNGGTMSISDWVNDGRFDRDLAGQANLSLFNLLHHSEIDLDILMIAVQARILQVEADGKDQMKYTYATLQSFKMIIGQAIQEIKVRGDKTMEELKEKLNG